MNGLVLFRSSPALAAASVPLDTWAQSPVAIHQVASSVLGQLATVFSSNGTALSLSVQAVEPVEFAEAVRTRSLRSLRLFHGCGGSTFAAAGGALSPQLLSLLKPLPGTSWTQFHDDGGAHASRAFLTASLPLALSFAARQVGVACLGDAMRSPCEHAARVAHGLEATVARTGLTAQQAERCQLSSCLALQLDFLEAAALPFFSEFGPVIDFSSSITFAEDVGLPAPRASYNFFDVDGAQPCVAMLRRPPLTPLDNMPSIVVSPIAVVHLSSSVT
jgi:hypothetical protein